MREFHGIHPRFTSLYKPDPLTAAALPRAIADLAARGLRLARIVVEFGSPRGHAVIEAARPEGGVVQARRLARTAGAGQTAAIDAIARRVLGL